MYLIVNNNNFHVNLYKHNINLTYQKMAVDPNPWFEIMCDTQLQHACVWVAWPSVTFWFVPHFSIVSPPWLCTCMPYTHCYRFVCFFCVVQYYSYNPKFLLLHTNLFCRLENFLYFVTTEWEILITNSSYLHTNLLSAFIYI